MPTQPNRRTLLRGLAGSTLFFSYAATANTRQDSNTPAAAITQAEPNRPAPLEPNLVQEFVRVCHRDLTRATQLIDQSPKLVYASWDLGGGDWETGLGAASHVGNRPIAKLLLKHGARKDIFASAMLGERDVVLAMIKADPNMVNQVGPHGFRVLYHAAISGDVVMAEGIASQLPKQKPHLNQALSAAVRDGHYDMTEWLLKQGATSINKPSPVGETPLQTAQRLKDQKLEALLRQHGATDEK